MKPHRGQERNPTEEKYENTILDRIYIFFTFAILLVIFKAQLRDEDFVQLD
jgi:hypothetical protein